MIVASTEQRLNPFPGLRPFRSDEHHLFFGREDQTAALLGLLRENRFLAVVGTSGSGKSSLVRAGMIAALHGGTMTQAGSNWEVIVLRPGGNPIENLARALIEADLYDADNPQTLPRLLATLNRSRFGLVEAVKQSDAIGAGSNLLVVVDQFEELFRFRQQGIGSEEAATAFVNLLLTAGQQSERSIYVTITMRSDYLGDCSEIPGLAEAVNDGEYLIPRLLRDQKRDAIEKPIGVGGAKVSPLLVQRLLNDVGDDPDQLPVLQHALMRMWDVWSARSGDGQPIDFCDFESIGGLEAALSNHADEIYESLPDDRHRRACERIFKTLTEKGADNRGIRRPTRLAKLAAIAGEDQETIKAVLDAFRQGGVTFLMPGMDQELEERTVIDLSHESLMRGWQRLRGWVEEEAQSARIFRRLSDTDSLWRDGKAGLFRDPDLQIALSWRDEERPNADWAELYGGDYASAIDFLERSAAEVEADRQAREAARQRELEQARKLAEAERLRAEEQRLTAKRLKGMVAGLAAAALLAVGAFVVAMLARNQAITARNDAEEAQRDAEAERTKTQELADANDKLAKTAQKQKEVARENDYISRTRSAQDVADAPSGASRLQRMLNELRPLGDEADLRGWEWYYLNAPRKVDGRVINASGSLYCLDVNPRDDQQLVFSGRTGELVIWNRRANREVLTLAGHESSVINVSWSPDGQWIASGSLDGTARIWDPVTGLELHKLSVATSGQFAVIFVAWSPDSTTLATTGGGTASLWNAATGEQVRELGPSQGRCAFSPNGKRLAAGNAPDAISVWDLETEAPPKTFKTNVSNISPLAWSLDGAKLVVGVMQVGEEANNAAVILDAETGDMKGEPLAGHDDSLFQVAWSPDGQFIATASMDGTARIYSAATGRFIRTLRGDSTRLYDVAWCENGQSVGTAGWDGKVIIWNLKDQEQSHDVLATQLGDITALDWSPDGRYFVAASGVRPRQLNRATLTVFDARTGKQVTELSGLTSWTYTVAWSSDGKWIAAADGNQVRIWDPKQEKPVGELTDAGSYVQQLAWHPDPGRTRLAAATAKGIVVWDVKTATEPFQLSKPVVFGAATGISCIAWSPDGSQVAYAESNPAIDKPRPQIRIWNAETGEEDKDRALYGESDVIQHLTWSPDGGYLASAGYPHSGFAGTEPVLRIWDVTARQQTTIIRDHTQAITALQWSPASLQPTSDAAESGRESSLRDARLVSASQDGAVRVWHPRSGRELLKFAGSGRPAGAVAWSPSGMQIVVGDDQGKIRLYDARGGYGHDHSRTLLAGLKERIDSNSASTEDLLLRAGIQARLGKWDLAAHDYQTASSTFPGDENGMWCFSPWWVLGPFPEQHAWNAAATDPFAELPESIAAGQPDAQPIRWQPVFPRADSGLNLRDYFEVADHTSCYVYTRVYSPRQQSAGLLLGSDDTHEIWLNGQVVHAHTKPRAAARDQNACLVTLEQGWNTIVARVNNGIGGFDLYLRLSNDPLELASAFERSEEWSNALAQWDRAIEADPKNVALRIRSARAAHQAEKPERALADYAAALELVPNNAALIRRRAELLRELDRGQEALAEYRRLVELQPNDWGLRLEIGRLYAEILGSQDDGTAPAPLDHPAELLGRSLGFAALGKQELADADIEAAVKLAQDASSSLETVSQGFMQQAQASASKGHFKVAIAVLSQLIRIRPDSFDAVYERGQLYARTGQWRAAADDLTRAIELNPQETGAAARDRSTFINSPGPRYRLAPLLAELGELDRYQEHCRTYLEQFREASAQEAGRALQACLWVPDGLADWEGEAQLAERTLSTARRPTVKGMYFYRAGRIKEALEWIPKTLDDRVPWEKARALFFWAMALKKDNQAPEAEAKLKEAEALLQQGMRGLQIGNPLSTVWHDWVAARVLRREAVALIRGPEAGRQVEIQDLRDRALFAGRRDNWQDALVDLKRLIELEPDKSLHWLQAAPLLVVTGDMDGYRDHCRRMAQQFGNSDIWQETERTAKACMLRPDVFDDMPTVFSLLAKTRTQFSTQKPDPWYYFAQALAEMRAQKPQDALDHARGNTADADSSAKAAYLSEANRVVLALAYQGVGQLEPARKELKRASKSIDAALAADSVPGNWHDLLIADILRREAEAAINGKTISAPPNAGAADSKDP